MENEIFGGERRSAVMEQKEKANCVLGCVVAVEDPIEMHIHVHTTRDRRAF